MICISDLYRTFVLRTISPCSGRVGQDILRKDVYERYLLLSNLANLNVKKIRQRKRPLRVYNALMVTFACHSCCIYTRRGLMRCLSLTETMREPDSGISRSTESHVFLFYIWYRPTSGDSYRRESL